MFSRFLKLVQFFKSLLSNHYSTDFTLSDSHLIWKTFYQTVVLGNDLIYWERAEAGDVS